MTNDASDFQLTPLLVAALIIGGLLVLGGFGVMFKGSIHG